MKDVDVVIVGAGFAGLYALHRMHDAGLSAVVFEAGAEVGGTWYWNRYPGCRCDVESIDYQFGFSEGLQRGWTWKERYASQSEIRRYLNYVADVLDLRRDIQLNQRVTSAVFNEEKQDWLVNTNQGTAIRTRYCIMATGCLSASRMPEIAGLDEFKGRYFHTARWPEEPVDFKGQRVGVIGTGSSGVQAIPLLAQQAKHLYVFQRTANFSMPAFNRPLTAEEIAQYKDNMLADRQRAHYTFGGNSFQLDFTDKTAAQMSEAERRHVLEDAWNTNGIKMYGVFADMLTNEEANDHAAEFVRGKIRDIVKDPEVAERLCPRGHPMLTKRPCFDTNYYETYNRPNVTLVSIKDTPIERITEKGLQCRGRHYELDDIIFATGFDAITGALLSIDIRGRFGQRLREKWAAGPRTYLGLGTEGFPNLFFITGPGSPSVLSNMVVSIEQHVDWIKNCIAEIRNRRATSIDVEKEAEDRWVEHVNEIAGATLFMKANSWYLGANVPGKPRVFMPYVGGLGTYKRIIEQVEQQNYEGFRIR